MIVRNMFYVKLNYGTPHMTLYGAYSWEIPDSPCTHCIYVLGVKIFAKINNYEMVILFIKLLIFVDLGKSLYKSATLLFTKNRMITKIIVYIQKIPV